MDNETLLDFIAFITAVEKLAATITPFIGANNNLAAITAAGEKLKAKLTSLLT